MLSDQEFKEKLDAWCSANLNSVEGPMVLDAVMPPKQLCEGTANSLSKILNFHDLDIRSFFVSEAEDGSIQADVQIRTGGAHAVTG